MTGSLEHVYALPPDIEDARVRSVEQLQLLDSPPEERFSRVTQMARMAFGLPMAAVSLLDRDRQWFKQVDGLDLGDNGSIPRGDTVCQATVARAYRCPDDPALILTDAEDSEFATVPGIGGENGIRFYAGYPLYGPGGHPVGTFCIYDTSPRTLSSAQLQMFEEFAAWAQRELERSDDIERAAAVQRQLLPLPLGDLPGYTVGALCLPAYAVGGDFYDHYRVGRSAVFTVADVMGKGLGAAILAASVRSALRAASRAVERIGAHADIADSVNSVAELLADDLSITESFVTVFHARLDIESGTVECVDAGHGFAAIARWDGTTDQLRGPGLPLGVLAGDVWDSFVVQLNPGDTLVVASDGILDLIGDGIDTRHALRFVGRHRDPDDLCRQARMAAADVPPLDDITLVAVRRDPQ